MENLDQLVERLDDLIEHLTTIRSDLVRSGGPTYDSPDVRQLSMDGIQQHLLAVRMWTQAYTVLSTANNPPRFGLTHPQQPDTGKLEEAMFNTLRFALLTQPHFLLEVLLSKVYELANIGKSEPFPEKLKELKGAGFLDEPFFNTLECIRRMRNSFHNNGVHNGKNVQYSISGRCFSFANGKEVDCAGFANIVELFGVTIVGLGDLMPRIAKLWNPPSCVENS